MSGQKDAATLFQEVGEHPTLDVIMQRDPREGRSRSDAMAFIALERARRAALITEAEAVPEDEQSEGEELDVAP